MAQSNQEVLSQRYSDAYRVANALVGLGQFVKLGGFITGALIIVLMIVEGSGSTPPASLPGSTPMPVLIPSLPSGALFFAALLTASVVMFVFWVMGVVVSAWGQMLMSTIDSAVNNSPFLSNDTKLQVMGIR